MSSFVLTNQYVTDFETDLSYRVTNAWNRTLKQIWWPRVMIMEGPKAARTNIIEWPVETAMIGYLGPHGKDIVYDPLLQASHEFGYDFFGNALSLDVNQISDDRIDRATAWTSQTGSASLYFPQRLASLMMIHGKSATNPVTNKSWLGYDGLPLFHKAHPIPGTNRTVSNLHNGVPFTATNAAKVIAYAESIRHGGNAPAGLMPTLLIAPTNFRLRGTQITSAEWFTDQLNGAAASAQNAFKMAFNFEAPIFAPELNNDPVPNTWFVGVPADQDAFQGALGLWQREEFSINTYQPASHWELARTQELKYTNKGRYGTFFGIPWLLHRCEEGGSLDAYLASISL